MVVLVIVPSGIGKSSAVRFAKTIIPGCLFACLDGFARDRGRLWAEIQGNRKQAK